ncbi:MAG: hypothetical protein HFH50_08410 [Lachnospiraceae bacterium]|jgi:inhibitor of cysteine peptidase|nr:hypothetical protein [Lachnospiraceae bacterium]
MMEKQELKEQWTEETIREYVKQAAESEPIPDKLQPKQMEKWLKQAMEEKGGRSMKEKKEKKSYRKWWCATASAAAFLAVVLFAAGRTIDWERGVPKELETKQSQEKAAGKETEKGASYQELYDAFSDIWKEQDKMTAYVEERSTDSAGADTGGEGGAELFAESTVEDAGAENSSPKESSGSKDYGKTNQQEAEVEEADIIKNDGRYLYQVVFEDRTGRQAVQIADTRDGLKEASRIEEFDHEIQQIYVWKDSLVVVESGWVNEVQEEDKESGNFLDSVKGVVDEMFSYGPGEDYREMSYSKIHIYNIEDRKNPELYHTFTLKGTYRDSRISDGYLYFFTACNAYRPRLEKDYQAYIPEVDGEPLAPEKIYLPEDTKTAAYLVMASINMEQPDQFTDTTAIVTGADRFYVSQNSIYVTDSMYVDYGTEGKQSDSTRIFRFSYQNGIMKKEAEGTVKGILLDDMAMNEYKGYLRMVTTVESQNVQEVKDDITGEVIGNDGIDVETSNSLYVLDENLKTAGKIENLAKDERIYSARFMGNAGYFVTFRQTDPLFSVDLSNTKKPKVLGELKISGFSEYLHFYGENLLLGIGMEADEETGATDGMKLSMFDISDPSDVKEQSKLMLPYDYAMALYDYKSVFIDTDKNLFGFSAEDYEEDYRLEYVLFTYADGAFQEKMKIDCSDSKVYSHTVRGTYIGERFYLMCANGRIEEYSLADGSKTGELEK